MYPGSCGVLSNGGANSSAKPSSRRINSRSSAAIARARAIRRRRAGQHRPGLRDGIDPTLVAGGRAERRAVVEIAPAVPFAVPGLALHGDLQCVGVHRPFFRARRLVARQRQRRERRQRRIQEPSEPDAFALALFADAVHAVVPVARPDEWKPMPPQRQACIERQRAMFEQRRASLERSSAERNVRLACFELGALEKRNQIRRARACRPSSRHIARPHRRARRGRRKSGSERPGRNAAATSVARRPRRTAAPPREADARASDRAERRRAPCHPATGRESHRRRWPDRRPSAPRRGRRASDRAASR